MQSVPPDSLTKCCNLSLIIDNFLKENSVSSFSASYLPKPSSQEYEFVYVDAKGEVCSRSSKFTFCAPRPLEDLVTLEDESHGEDEGTGMLLVIPRAEMLQVSMKTAIDIIDKVLGQCTVFIAD